MYRLVAVTLAAVWTTSFTASTHANSLEADMQPLLEASCFTCHSNTLIAPLDLKALGYDLSDPHVRRKWARVYDRIDRGEMPPEGAPRASDEVVSAALGSLRDALIEQNLEERDGLRTPLRRLTRLEYAHTLEDLLHLDAETALELGMSLPAEADSGGFDTIASKQGISALHVTSYLDAADRALDAAIRVGERPETLHHHALYTESQRLDYMHEAKILGGGITKKLDDAVVMFLDGGSTYLMHSQYMDFFVPQPGRYRITMEARAYQAHSPVTLTLYRGVKQGVTAQLNDLIGSWDLVGEEARTVSVVTYLKPGGLVSPSIAEADAPPGEQIVNYYAPDKNVKNYGGEGIAIKYLQIEGPLLDAWPPESTTDLLVGVDIDENGEAILTKSAYEHIYDIVERFGARALRRPMEHAEVEIFAGLARPILAAERPFLEAVRVPLRAILSSPMFIYQGGDPGALDDYRLATRLSYFLWRSMPDDALLAAAGAGELSDPQVLARHVDRMLDDPKAQRFVKDFASQAFRLKELKATTPDPGLYPEYDDRLGRAMALETELFLSELIAADLGIGNLVDSDFTFVNRRLAEHYGIPEVTGQGMRKVTLPADSVRGGLLTQAAIHKITANGTSTSPVPRGNFVLASVLGKPAPPPPPNVAGLEPDTRGTTTIREQLSAHRANPTCASCHRTIDPPGFALESFDPIGGQRHKYRIPKPGVAQYEYPKFQDGLPVDASGVTPQGQTFAGIEDYKEILLTTELEQIARHFTSQLLAFGTGEEVGFADRDTVEAIVETVGKQGYPVRTMIKEVVNSALFKER